MAFLSQYGQMTMFRFSDVRYSTEGAGRHKMSSEEGRVESINRTLVAFIDSSRMTRETFRIYIEKSVSSIRVLSFSSLDDYLSSMGSLVFDLIIYSVKDSDTSNMSGWDELTEIAEKASPIPVLALVDTPYAAAMTRAEKCGAAYCIQIFEDLSPIVEMLKQFRSAHHSSLEKILKNRLRIKKTSIHTFISQMHRSLR